MFSKHQSFLLLLTIYSLIRTIYSNNNTEQPVCLSINFFKRTQTDRKRINIPVLIKKKSTVQLNYTAVCEICHFLCISVSVEEEPLATAIVKDSAGG